jgi:hypothetical protein
MEGREPEVQGQALHGVRLGEEGWTTSARAESVTAAGAAEGVARTDATYE